MPAMPLFQCPFCNNSFGERPQLSVHIQESHTVKRPFLLIAGAEPGVEDVIRKSVNSHSVQVFNCTELAVGFDGEPIQPIRAATLAQRLTKLQRATVRLRLLNGNDDLIEPVIQEYRLKILAPDDAALAKVDALFLAQLGTDKVDLQKVGEFYVTTRDGAAAEYAEALADYVRAVLLKDGDPRTGVSTRLHHYHEIQARALRTLQSFERPLAMLLCALIRFGLNDFSRWSEATGFADLDHAHSVLGPLAQIDRVRAARRKSISGQDTARVFVCPVDLGSDTVTQLAKQAAKLRRWGSAADEQFSALADRANMDSFDRAKIRALWAFTALRLAADESADRALRLLDGDPTFGDWAGSKLAKAKL
jgi:hypothetical protein